MESIPVLKSLFLATALMLATMPVTTPATAAGWSGGDHHLFTAAFPRGYTLKSLWNRTSAR